MQVHAYNKNNWLRAALMLTLFGSTLAFVFAGCGGGGGGGGGSTSGPVATVSGIVFSASSDTPPTGPASIVIGGTTLTSNTADGTFSGNVSSSAKSATISASGEVTRTIAISISSGQVNNLGTIFLADTGSDYSANVNGVVVTTVKGATQPVGGATVTIGNVTGISKTDGTFALTGLPVGLGSVNGLYGTVTASGFAVKLITADVLGFALVTGNNNIGNLLLATASGSTPNPPFTISGVVNVAGKPTAGVTVAIALAGGGASLGQTQTDSNGNYFFWVAPAAYAITATDNANATGGVTITLKALATPVTAPVINLAQ